ncbi:MAG: hypothetical protein CSA09_00865 [Candidatus Contendobacter odensis]|uniref:Uncharacterized protein n=1 Tax=Candidatus Contendibacter odensensis TaxID=1400860 RepID=A0A2G6PFX6_9GAMM|nr:MAG: hypothetical protein CSA09_00865 [Candidatus Contendobacter odensis]
MNTSISALLKLMAHNRHEYGDRLVTIMSQSRAWIFSSKQQLSLLKRNKSCNIATNYVIFGIIYTGSRSQAVDAIHQQNDDSNTDMAGIIVMPCSKLIGVLGNLI